jgi:hypothetical protein
VKRIDPSGTGASSRAVMRVAFLLRAPVAESRSKFPPPRLQVEGGQFLLHSDDGSVVRGQDLKGAIIKIRNSAAPSFEVRIEAVEPSPFGDVELYALVIRRNPDDPWSALCRPGPDGRARAIPLRNNNNRGASETAAAHADFSLVCTAGAKGKCIMRGYRPWATSAEGQSVAPYYEACIRMMRADYCGDGQSYTHEGIRIDSWDRLGIRLPSSRLPLEAAWDSHGAVCIARTRVPSIATLAALVDRCPALATRVRPDCSDIPGQPGGEAILWNRSEDSGTFGLALP